MLDCLFQIFGFCVRGKNAVAISINGNLPCVSLYVAQRHGVCMPAVAVHDIELDGEPSKAALVCVQKFLADFRFLVLFEKVDYHFQEFYFQCFNAFCAEEFVNKLYAWCFQPLLSQLQNFVLTTVTMLPSLS